MTRDDRQLKISIVLGTLCVMLALLCVHFARRGGAAPTPASAPPPAVDDEQAMLELAAMVAASEGVWDSHPDPDVSRVLQPRLEGREFAGAALDSNRFGLRERDYELPKPAGTVRVVLLGDSYVLGSGVEADARFGVHLERFLRERTTLAPPPEIEVLHVGCSSWNLVAESAFLRRQLSLMQPDLVLHYSVSNDLSDTNGVRGMGSMGQLVPRAPTQTDAIVTQQHGRWELHPQSTGHLARGLDAESRERFADARDHMQRLVAALEARGARYLHLFGWSFVNPAAARFLAPALTPEQVAWLPPSFSNDLELRLAKNDPHWNPRGHEQVARYLFGLIEARDLLPELELRAWPEAVALAAQLNDAERARVEAPTTYAKWAGARPTPAVFDLAAVDRDSASLVHTGVDGDGTLGPYASILLARDGGTRLRVVGRCLDRPELDGGEVRVSLDEHELARIPLRAGEPVDLTLTLPPALLERDWLTLRFVADDYAYAGDTLRHCVSFQLARAALEP